MTNPQATHFLNQLANDNSGSQLQQNLASCAVQPHSEKQRKTLLKRVSFVWN